MELQEDVKVVDPEIYELVCQEKERQRRGLELIASENFTSRAVLQVSGSCLMNKISEGRPGQRYYGGNEIIDKVELLCQKRALELYGLDPEKWGVNVQIYSGTPANFAVYTAVVGPHGRIMGLHLPDGGHLSHGYLTSNKRVSASSIYFESFPYRLDPSTGLIDYDKLRENARLFLPKLIVAGVSCYSRHLEYKTFREIADEVNAMVLADIAHVSGLVAGGQSPSPFHYCDLVTTTTYKTLRGPKAAMIFYRKGVRKTLKSGETQMYDLERKINEAVFPGLQGVPHNHMIGAVAVSLKQAANPDFAEYTQQVVANARALCSHLQDKGYSVVSGGTDTHLFLIDLRPQHLDGARVEKVLENMSISVNKNTCPGDVSAVKPSGIRLGSAALTSRGMKEADFEKIGDLVHEAVKLAQEVQKDSGPTLREFKTRLDTNPRVLTRLRTLRTEVEQFADQFPLPGIQDW